MSMVQFHNMKIRNTAIIERKIYEKTYFKNSHFFIST